MGANVFLGLRYSVWASADPGRVAEVANRLLRKGLAHADEQRRSADLLLSFGCATWPHLLVRAMLAEQLFRATSILANHPYHREG